MSESQHGFRRVREILREGRRRAPDGRLDNGVSDWAKSVLLALLLFLFVRTSVVEAFKIPTSSMEGTLLVGDFLLVNKAVYGAPVPGTDRTLPPFAEPERGDVIVFHPPHEPDKNYVKRVVGAAGDTLEMRRKVLYRNGMAIDEPYALFKDQGGADAMHPAMRWQLDRRIWRS